MQFPEYLAERWCRRQGQRRDGEFVLYWMRTAVRGHENPALDAALIVGRATKLPVLVYHGLSERTPYANDRHHTFILEGARDVSRELAHRNIPYAFHLERDGHRGPVLKQLAERAAVVITEEMPVHPLRAWTERLTTVATVWTWDTACVVPMPLVGQKYTRAFRYRDQVRDYRCARIARLWEEQPNPEVCELPELPFEPLEFENASFRDLVASCEIDHGIAPVSHTRGGSQQGYARWARFRENGLKRYGRMRNDPLKNGVSRMSAYLHYGQVSPLRLAREAHAVKAEKYLDELITWRELAYTYCYHEPDVDSVEALPAWALESLRSAEGDQRPELYSWETLARARTGDALWDACQNSLLVHGELHNNVRMTWGKAFLQWTPNVERALELALDLNHRYALDGRDPSSYGGLLWCFGQFDKPFNPPQKITGSLRPRSTEQHARRLDVEAYRQKVAKPLVNDPPRVAVIGAGISGLICARTLKDHGVPVTVFDKGRSSGGRTSTRRIGNRSFDHGAPYFVARDREFQRYVHSWRVDGVIAEWQGRAGIVRNGIVEEDTGVARRFVGTPSMSSVASHLRDSMDTRFGVRVTAIRGGRSPWRLESDHDRLGEYDVVLVATPASQACDLLQAGWLRERLQCVSYAPIWSLMVSVDDEFDWPWDSMKLDDEVISWVARNESKPKRGSATSLVAQASRMWSRSHVDDQPDTVRRVMIQSLCRKIPVLEQAAHKSAVHRWRYALVEETLDIRCLWDEDHQLGACGDWALGGRVEDAFKSGVALAGRVLGWLGSR